ncbi:hypothetical protein APR04_002365 [Promicromonospora umidemergens]|nr:hypothetical protein [Promicromonospora umidemergens]
MLVIGQDHRFYGHAWLERGDSFYDPTAHQFPGIDVVLRGRSPNPLGNTLTRETFRQPVGGLDDGAHRTLREALRPIFDHQLGSR